MNERDIFIAATQIEDAELRAAFLDTVCRGDLLLQHRIDKLLGAEVASASLVSRPGRLIDKLAGEIAESDPGENPQDAPPAFDSAPQNTIKQGTIIGPYQIQQLLGEGGMGVVYAAKQTSPVQRQVALKILRPGDNSRNVLARFEQERHALAMMDHPGIAKILDAGATADGRPYFVMELVKGIPINEYCDRVNLPPKERLKLFIPVCAAVQHAHQKGIIHRDLKPSNILIALYDGKPVPKVIDFGVAKAIGFRLSADSVYTEVGSIVGTVEYMAPEQAELNNLDIDTRADVYALGVILYELLTGSPPFTRGELRSAAFDEMLRMIREVEPQKPSTRISSSNEIASIAAHRKLEPRQLTRMLAGDLDWVVMKALAKERKRRYQTVGDLSNDVSRFLNCEAVEAGPPTLRYKLSKFVSRNRSSVAAVALTLLVMVAAIVGVSYALSIAIREGQAKTIALESERVALEEVSEANDKTLATLRSMTDTVLATHMARQWELTSEDRRFLSEIHQRYAEFANADPHSRASRAIRAEGLTRQAMINKLLGDRNVAREGMQKALADWEVLARDFPDEPEWPFEIALCHQLIGDCDLDERRLGDAELQFAKSIDLMTSIRAQASEFPNFMYSLAENYHSLGVTLYQLKRQKEALAVFAQALETSRNGTGEETIEYRVHSQMASINNSWASQLQAVGQYDLAIERYKAAIELAEKVIEQFPDKPGTELGLAMSHGNLANLLRRTNRMDQSEVHLDKSIAILERLAESYPVITKFQYHLAYSLKTRARLASDQKDWESAIELEQRALSITGRLLESSPDDSRYLVQAAELHQMLGQAHKFFENDEAAVSEFRLAIEILQSLCTRQPGVVEYQVKLASAENDLGVLFKNKKSFEKAELHLKLALDIREKLATSHVDEVQYQVDFAGSLCNFANFLFSFDRPGESMSYYDRGQRLLLPVVEKHPELALAKKYLRNVYAGQLRACSALEKYVDAMAFADKAIALDDGSQKLIYQQLKLACQAHFEPEIAVAGGEKLIESYSDDAGVLYEVACVCAIASEKTESAEQKDRFGARAMELLNHCHSLNMFSTPKGKLKLDVSELDPFRESPEFQNFLNSVNKPDADVGVTPVVGHLIGAGGVVAQCSHARHRAAKDGLDSNGAIPIAPGEQT